MWHEREKKHAQAFALCLLTLWLCVCGSSCGIAEGSEEVLYVPAGWTSVLPGYWLSEAAGRDLVTGWSADRAELTTLRNSLSAQFDRAEDIPARWRNSTDTLEARIIAERTAHAAEVKRLKHQLQRPGFIVGVGVSHEGEFRGVVGIGWKF